MSTDSPTPKRLVPTEYRTYFGVAVVYKCDPPPPVHVSREHGQWQPVYQDADGDWMRSEHSLDLTGYTIVAEGEPAPGEVVPSTDAFTPEHVGGSAVARITAALGLDPSASVDEVVARIGAVAEELAASHAVVRAAHEALDAMPAATAPDCVTPAQRIKYATHAWLDERKEAAHLATLCQDAHDALTEAGIGREGTPADRIGRLVAARREQEDLDDIGALLTKRDVADDESTFMRVRDALDQRDDAQDDLARFVGRLRRAMDLNDRVGEAEVVVEAEKRLTRSNRGVVLAMIDIIADAGDEARPHLLAALRAEVEGG